MNYILSKIKIIDWCDMHGLPTDRFIHNMQYNEIRGLSMSGLAMLIDKANVELCLNLAFHWDSSPEGLEYWKGVAREYQIRQSNNSGK